MSTACAKCNGKKRVWNCTYPDERQTKLEKCGRCKGTGVEPKEGKQK